MDPAVSCAAAGEDRPVKGADLGLLDVCVVTGEVDLEFLKFEDEKKDDDVVLHMEDRSVVNIQVSYEAVSVEKDILCALFDYKDGSVIKIQVSDEAVSVEKDNLSALFDKKDVSYINIEESYGAVSFEKLGDLFDQFKDERKVIGWNAKHWISCREEKKISQATKGGIAAAKKGLGYFCYGSYGAHRGKF